jgi:putative acetyltransferase
MIIRAESQKDITAVDALNRAAFETDAEARLVALLRTEATPVISLVAEADELVVGHIMFSPVTAEGAPAGAVLGLAPMAVLPEHQRRGIGSELVRAGLDACHGIGVTALVVLGHPEFYPRFGFVPASRFGLGSEYSVPDDVFMAMELEQGSLAGVSGVVRYHPAFGTL